ncbi:MAG TPA: TonB-dependent receptor [Steroidobacteraceae bacterium]|nr:TonB-dependent receptor [Steroidobacteraceae bacterium]
MKRQLLLAVLAMPALALAADPAPLRDPIAELSHMSLEQLAKVEVTSVSRAAQSLSRAPASIYVITREEILRSGALSIPEALRLAPNLHVTQISATDYQVGARGFGGALEAQNFSNKILILIDGRSVYNPLFSGVAYDAQDVFMDDVDRIEVISGPGATLWGSNAMNGVINIITRRAAESQGTTIRATAGDRENALAARYGGEVANGAFRVYAKAFDRGPTELEDGASAGDRWHKVQGGFRYDTGNDTNDVTVQGDWQQAGQNMGANPEVEFNQFNVLGRWENDGERVDSRLQAFVDQTRRDRPTDGVAFSLDTYDLEFQQTVAFGTKHQVVWGLGKRFNDVDITNTPTLAFDPANHTIDLTNVFAQDTIRISEHFSATAGIKFEENSYSGWTTLPDLRVSWTPTDTTLVWAAAARAVRAPTPLDVDVRETVGGQLFLVGNPDFRTEKVTAYELGYRSQPHRSISWSVSAFYNDYEDLRSIEITPVTLLPLQWGNEMAGSTYGVEIWGNWQVASWWRLSPGFRSLHKRLHFTAAGSGLGGFAQSGNDPDKQASLKSSMAFGRVNFDAMLRYVGRMPSPANPDYTELSARLAYRLSDALELSIAGFNLLDDRHPEYALPTGRELRRSVYAEARVEF